MLMHISGYAKLETESALREISDSFDCFPHNCCILQVFHGKMQERYNSMCFILTPILFNLMEFLSCNFLVSRKFYS